MRSISSKVRRSSRVSQSSPSAGMQYVQRKLQRSVTEMRRSRWTRPKPSISGTLTPPFWPNKPPNTLWKAKPAWLGRQLAQDQKRHRVALIEPVAVGHHRQGIGRGHC